MEKIAMREYLADLEARIDEKLKKWKKERIENGDKIVHLTWQFESSHIMIDVFWDDEDEFIEVECKLARAPHRDYEFQGLTAETIERVIDRVGNFAMIAMNKFRK